jgi:hypothetical protein
MTSIVPQGRGALWIADPGTWCLATISLSLRDKSHSPVEGPRIKLALVGFGQGRKSALRFGWDSPSIRARW